MQLRNFVGFNFNLTVTQADHQTAKFSGYTVWGTARILEKVGQRILAWKPHPLMKSCGRIAVVRLEQPHHAM